MNNLTHKRAVKIMVVLFVFQMLFGLNTVRIFAQEPLNVFGGTDSGIMPEGGDVQANHEAVQALVDGQNDLLRAMGGPQAQNDAAVAQAAQEGGAAGTGETGNGVNQPGPEQGESQNTQSTSETPEPESIVSEEEEEEPAMPEPESMVSMGPVIKEETIESIPNGSRTTTIEADGFRMIKTVTTFEQFQGAPFAPNVTITKTVTTISSFLWSPESEEYDKFEERLEMEFKTVVGVMIGANGFTSAIDRSRYTERFWVPDEDFPVAERLVYEEIRGTDKETRHDGNGRIVYRGDYTWYGDPAEIIDGTEESFVYSPLGMLIEHEVINYEFGSVDRWLYEDTDGDGVIDFYTHTLPDGTIESGSWPPLMA